ncbi:hypothetical protein FOA52_004355 [Chlamydomonas sp. UWO 241]|nr:hypothetical protein FOA52_004355 [Chlamydomonas sp. UWO 241]
MASSLALEIRAELDALQRDPEVVIPVARGVLFRMGGPFKHWEKGWYSINHLGGLVFSDGDDMRDAKPVLDHIVTASAVQCEQWKGASLMHAFQGDGEGEEEEADGAGAKRGPPAEDARVRGGGGGGGIADAGHSSDALAVVLAVVKAQTQQIASLVDLVHLLVSRVPGAPMQMPHAVPHAAHSAPRAAPAAKAAQPARPAAAAAPVASAAGAPAAERPAAAGAARAASARGPSRRGGLPARVGETSLCRSHVLSIPVAAATRLIAGRGSEGQMARDGIVRGALRDASYLRSTQHVRRLFSDCYGSEETAVAAAAVRVAAAAVDGVSLPVCLAMNLVRFVHDVSGRDRPAGGGVVSASFLNAKPAVGGIGVEPRRGGVLRVLFTVASDAVADTVVRSRRNLRDVDPSAAVFDVLSDREEAQHRALWPAFLAAKAARKRAQFHRARLVVDGERVMSSNGDARVLFCEDAVCRNHWVMTVNEAVRRSLALLGRPMQLADHYAIDYSSKLGSGLFAVVLRATDLKSGQSVAIKAIKPERFREHQPLIMREVSAWSTVGTHPRTVHLLGSFQSASRMYFVCELCPGGGLLSSLARNAAFCERDAARVMRQVLEGLAHIHARGVVHCDLKPENIITMSKADRADIKIADFGLSAFMGRPMQVGGTPEFVAPELLRDPEHFMGAGVGGEVDMWSAGVLLYYLLSGTTPFFASSFDKIVAKVQVGTWTFKGPAWAEVSAAAKDLVKILLCPLPDRRPSASQALANPWVAREGSAPTRVLATAVAAFRVQAREEASASGAEQEPQLPPMSSQRPSAPGLSLSAQPSPFSSPRVRAGSSMSGVPDRQLAPRPARPPRLGESSPFDAITERSQPVGSLFMWGEDASDGHVDAAICAMAGPRPAAVRRTGCIMSEYGAMAGSAQLDRATYGNSANNGVGAFDPPAHGRASCSGTYMTASGSFAMDSGSMTPQQFVASPMQSMSQAPMSPHCLYNVSVAGTEQRPSSQIVELQRAGKVDE